MKATGLTRNRKLNYETRLTVLISKRQEEQVKSLMLERGVRNPSRAMRIIIDEYFQSKTAA